MTKVYVFQDGTLESQLLQAELRERDLDLDVKVVDSEDVIEWFTKIKPDQKVYLHLCYEDYIKNNEKLRRELDKLERMGFKNLIVREYEGLDRKTMEQRCKDRGFKTVKVYDRSLLNKDEVEIDKPYFEIPGKQFEDKSNAETIKKVKEVYKDERRKKRLYKM